MAVRIVRHWWPVGAVGGISMDTVMRIIGTLAAVLLSLFFATLLVIGFLWPIREVLGAVVVGLIGLYLLGVTYRFVLATWRNEKGKDALPWWE